MKIKEKTRETSLIMPVTLEFIERRIRFICDKKVMLDSDLAELYQVSTRDLNKAVRRNIDRFPSDFMFQLNKKEFENLMFQIGTSSWGGRRKLPYVFTELGVAMLSSVLNSDKAVRMNIFIMRAFVALRKLLSTHADLASKIKELENGQEKHSQHIIAISSILDKLLKEGARQKDAIGFVVDP